MADYIQASGKRINDGYDYTAGYKRFQVVFGKRMNPGKPIKHY